MHSRMQTRPTISDVAKACGVSEATVSYVINGKRVLKADTRERVFRAMREMNYHPSAVARGLSSKKVFTFGVLLGAVDSLESMTNAYSSGLLRGIMARAQQEGFNLTFFTAPWINAEMSAPALRDGRTDGILAIAPATDSDILEGLISLNMPLVVIAGPVFPGITGVDVDNRAGVLVGMRHLIRLGHRRIAFLTGNENLASFEPRIAGYEAALEEAGIPLDPALKVVSRFDGAVAEAQIESLLSLPDPPTAVFAGNDSIALRAMAGARRLGKKVPEDISIVGFDDAPEAPLAHPPLTTVRQPLKEIGELATRRLIEAIRQGEHLPMEYVFMDPELVIRKSTAAPGTGRAAS